MTDEKTAIVVYDVPGSGQLIRPDEPVNARNAPAFVKLAGKAAEFAWEEFFQAEIANAHTRKNYIHAVKRFLAWAEERSLTLPRVSPGDVGEYLQGLDMATPTSTRFLRPMRRTAPRRQRSRCRHVLREAR